MVSDEDPVLTFQQFRHQCRPARLVTGPQALARIPVEIFVKKGKVLPSRVLGIARFSPVAGPVALGIRQEKPAQAFA